MDHQCLQCRQSFRIDEDDLSFYEKIQVPPPTWCPDCRLQRRIMWRCERSLYKRKCDLCQKEIIAIYSPDKPHKVYCRECYYSDKWNPLDYGRDFDFSRPFFEQFKKLQISVPRQYAWVFQNVNSEYTNGAAYDKNCYLIFVSDHNEDSMYSYAIYDCRTSLDLYNCNECELCYESITCKKCYQVFFSQDCSNSRNLYLCKNCNNSSDCIGSVNLRNARYQIFNQQYTKEEYAKIKEGMKLETRSGLESLHTKAHDFWKNFPQKYIHGLQNINVIGDYTFNSKNTVQTYDSELLEDCKFINHGNKAKNCYDAYVLVDNCQNSCEIIGSIAINNTKFSCWAWNGFNIEYSDMCENSNNLFGCINLRKQEYCILNKKYSKEEYIVLRDKIIAHMKATGEYGEFFPADVCPFAYNESVVQEYFPLTKEQALAKGLRWKEPEGRNYQVTLSAQDIPDSGAPADILERIIGCAHDGACNDGCTTAFRITPNELQFYQRSNLPLPNLCHNCRYSRRLRQRNPLKLCHRSCQCAGAKSSNGVYANTASHHHGVGPCPNEFETSYATDRKEIVYCESCYQQEVV